MKKRRKKKRRRERTGGGGEEKKRRSRGEGGEDKGGEGEGGEMRLEYLGGRKGKNLDTFKATLSVNMKEIAFVLSSTRK